MSAKHTIVINGKVYDAVSGLPVAKPMPVLSRPAVAGVDVVRVARTPHKPAHDSTTIHQTTAHSTTLRRQHLNAPTSQVPTSAPVRHAAGHTGRSPMIIHFASHPQPLPKHSSEIVEAISAPPSRTVTHIAAPVRPTSVEVKEKLIAHASTKVDAVHHAAKHTKQKRRLLKPLGRMHIVTAALAIALLGGYLTYINMPGLSVSVAATQSGVAAKYPSFSPDGYSFEGPVAYQPGKVELNFKSNGGGEGYTIEQRASSWNSVAVLDNLVSSASNGKYETTSQNGVTIYTYGNNAAWSNGGVLYTISGQAPLDSDQLLHIAASM